MRGRAGRRPRGRPRGRGRGINRAQVQNPVAQTTKSYDDPDTPNRIPPFTPQRQPGLHLNIPIRRGTMTKAIDFFMLFFTMELFNDICRHTNTYGWIHVGSKSYYGDKDGAWIETCPEELQKFIALLLYFGLVRVSSFSRYWSTKTLYHGLWARSIMSRDRFKALLAMLHVVDPCNENDRDKLRKVTSFITHFKEKCQSLYQPFKQIAIDERMVKSKHRSGIRQYIKNKPTKWGIKLWVLADSANGYTWDFDVYAGKNANQQVSANGLGYDVVMRLVQPLVNQGYHLYFDNFYTSVKLVKDLFQLKIPSTGTAAENRREFPESMKRGKEWAKRQERGNMRWDRDGVALAMQWKDNRPVTIVTSIDNANGFQMIERSVKVNNRWEKKQVKQPISIHNYNHYMNAVDRSDQILAVNNTLRKCLRWWKTLFFHMIDIAVVNSYILFQLHRDGNPDVDDLQRPNKFSIGEYREELVRQLAGLPEYGQPPVYKPTPPPVETRSFETAHIMKAAEKARNCRVCYQTTKVEKKVNTYCSAPQCQVFLHCTQKNNCFELWHSKEYHR